MKKISVIIPMYNSESFIQQCLQSVMRQTWEDLEIIVVNDGSTDRGPEICEKLRAEDSRIQLFHQKKSGVSSARNYALDTAAGDYIFFLDSDDIIHPLLLEEMLHQMEEQQAGLAFCAYARGNSGQLEKVFMEMPPADERPRWQVAEGADTEKKFHKDDRITMSGIGGKMIRSSLLRGLRFDTELIPGEDTWFLYLLVSQQIRSVFSLQKWYYYRVHPKSVTQFSAAVREAKYYECARRIRDCEYQKGRFDFAMEWELFIIDKLEKNYAAMRRLQGSQVRDGRIQASKACQKIKKQAVAERGNPFYSRVPLRERLLFFSCFHCYLLFRIQGRCMAIAAKYKKRMNFRRRSI